MKYFILSEAVVVSVSGTQAERYLQARLTNDMKLLAPRRAILAGVLTPQGRTEALMTALSTAQNSFVLFADGGKPDSILEALKRFVVTERIEFADVSSQFVVLHLIPSREKDDLGALVPAPPVHGEEFSRITAGALEFISRRRSLDWGWDVIVPAAQISTFIERLHEKEAVELSPEQRLLLRLRAGVPLFPVEINSEHIFSESGLSQAISFTKGCYTGQEVIAKIDALGKPPRLLCRVSMPGAIEVSPGTNVTTSAESRPAGEVLSSAIDNECGVTLAYVSLRSSIDCTKEKLLIGSTEATVVVDATAPNRTGLRT